MEIVLFLTLSCETKTLCSTLAQIALCCTQFNQTCSPYRDKYLYDKYKHLWQKKIDDSHKIITNATERLSCVSCGIATFAMCLQQHLIADLEGKYRMSLDRFMLVAEESECYALAHVAYKEMSVWNSWSRCYETKLPWLKDGWIS